MGELNELIEAIKNYPEVENWEVLPGTKSIRVQFAGTPEDEAKLLRSLINSGIPLNEFHCTQESLEKIFLKLGHKQAS
ncbi:MAG TPA: hypothetical protein V6C58_08960 [Allocoleopsis sp.]